MPNRTTVLSRPRFCAFLRCLTQTLCCRFPLLFLGSSRAGCTVLPPDRQVAHLLNKNKNTPAQPPPPAAQRILYSQASPGLFTGIEFRCTPYIECHAALLSGGGGGGGLVAPDWGHGRAWRSGTAPWHSGTAPWHSYSGTEMKVGGAINTFWP